MTNYEKAYGLTNPLQDVFPKPLLASRAPLATDINYPLGQTWIRTTSNQAWILTSVTAGVATWALSSPGSSDVDTLTGDAGGPISPVLGDIVLAGGTNIGSTGAGNTITFNLDPAITLATSVTSPLYTAGAGVNLQITAQANRDIRLQMGDAAGANVVSFRNNAAVEVFQINSLGTLTMAALVVTGALTQTAGAVNIGMDNLGSAINIGGGNVIKAMTILSGAAAHTLAIGSAAAGAMTIDTAAGLSIDGATASNFTVTGAGQDLTLNSVGGSLRINASEADAAAILMEAGDAAGGVQIRAGSAGILIGNEADTAVLSLGDFAPTTNRTITIGGGTVVTAAVTDTIDIAPDGATTNANSISTVNINTGTVAVGQVLTNIASGAVTSGTHTTSIATGARAAGTMALNIMTGTGTKTANVGNADGLTTVNIDAITLINDSINVQTSINTGTSSGAVVIGNALAGAMTIDTAAGISLDAATASNFTVSAGSLVLDCTGVLELNSSAGIIGIGNDAVAQNINIGTGAADRVITIGNGTGVSSVVVNSGTAAASFAANATVHTTTIGSNAGASATIIQSGSGKIDFAGVVAELTADFIDVSGEKITFRQSPILQSNLTTGVAPTGATGDINIMSLENGIFMEQYILGAGQTIICPRMDTQGLNVTGDATAAEGFEYNWGAGRDNSKLSFTIGTSPAFYLQWRFRVADVSGLEPCYIGFRRTQANQVAGAIANYTDFVAYGPNDGISPGDCAISTQLNTGGLINTDTNDAFADGSTHTLRINVSALGVVTFLFDGAPPTVTQAFTFDNGDIVHPFWRAEFNAVVPGAIDWVSMECGAQ